MPVKTKSRDNAELAARFRAEAKALTDKLLDPNVPLTADEVRNIQDGANALNVRAAAVANFTPDDEIEDQGGLGDDGVIVRGSPEHQDRRVVNPNEQRVADLRAAVAQEFGGPNSLILALARKQVQPLTTRQQRVVQELEELTKRTITGVSGNASNAEVLLPLQQVESIFQVPMEVPGIMAYAQRFTVNGRTLRIPHLKQTDASASNRPMAGIADVTIVGEAGQKTEFEPKFAQRVLTVYKYAGYTELGDETFDDDMTGELAPTIQNVIGGQIQNKVNEDITFDGTGSAMPLAAFNNANPALYRQARKTADAFKIEDVFNMYSRHLLGPSSAWFIHPSVVPQFQALTLNGTTLVTTTTDLRGRPVMMLLGLPVVVTPLVALLGDQGDVCLGNGQFYAMALRLALTIESSIHYRFRHDITAYRFYMRAGGIPIPDGTYSYKADNSVKVWEVSPFVVLDDVVLS